MIKIPQCLYCIHCENNKRCIAYPNGIPKEELYKKRENGQICKGNVKYLKTVKEEKS